MTDQFLFSNLEPFYCFFVTLGGEGERGRGGGREEERGGEEGQGGKVHQKREEKEWGDTKKEEKRGINLHFKSINLHYYFLVGFFHYFPCLLFIFFLYFFIQCISFQ